VGSYLYAWRFATWRAPFVIDCCYSSKGKVFFRTFSLRPSFTSQSEFIVITSEVIHNMKSIVGTKVESVAKLRAGKLWLNSRKRNRPKEEKTDQSMIVRAMFIVIC
jgi:hypothetical protein